nr:PREDICTED: GATA zinc finger domain-containing protein 14-like isoform X1 [Bemisia tabaci]
MYTSQYPESKDCHSTEMSLTTLDELILARSVSQMSVSIPTPSSINNRAAPALPSGAHLRSAGRGKVMSLYISTLLQESCGSALDDLNEDCSSEVSDSTLIDCSTTIADQEVEAVFSQSPSDDACCNITVDSQLSTCNSVFEDCLSQVSDSTIDDGSTVIVEQEIQAVFSRSPLLSPACSDITVDSQLSTSSSVFEDCLSQVSDSTIDDGSTVIVEQEIQAVFSRSPLSSPAWSDITVNSSQLSSPNHSNYNNYPCNRGSFVQNPNNYKRGNSRNSSINQNQTSHFNEQKVRGNGSYSAGRGSHKNVNGIQCEDSLCFPNRSDFPRNHGAPQQNRNTFRQEKFQHPDFNQKYKNDDVQNVNSWHYQNHLDFPRNCGQLQENQNICRYQDRKLQYPSPNQRNFPSQNLARGSGSHFAGRAFPKNVETNDFQNVNVHRFPNPSAFPRNHEAPQHNQNTVRQEKSQHPGFNQMQSHNFNYESNKANRSHSAGKYSYKNDDVQNVNSRHYQNHLDFPRNCGKLQENQNICRYQDGKLQYPSPNQRNFLSQNLARGSGSQSAGRAFPDNVELNDIQNVNVHCYPSYTAFPRNCGAPQHNQNTLCQEKSQYQNLARGMGRQSANRSFNKNKEVDDLQNVNTLRFPNHTAFPGNRGPPTQNQTSFQREKSEYSGFNQNQTRGSKSVNLGHPRKGVSSPKPKKQSVGRGKLLSQIEFTEPSFGISVSPPPSRSPDDNFQPTYGNLFRSLFFNPFEKLRAIGPVQGSLLGYDTQDN